MMLVWYDSSLLPRCIYYSQSITWPVKQSFRFIFWDELTPSGLVEFKSNRIILGDTPPRLYNSRPRLQFVTRECRCVLLFAQAFVLCFNSENFRIFFPRLSDQKVEKLNCCESLHRKSLSNSFEFGTEFQDSKMSTSPDPWNTFSEFFLKHKKAFLNIFYSNMTLSLTTSSLGAQQLWFLFENCVLTLSPSSQIQCVDKIWKFNYNYRI